MKKLVIRVAAVVTFLLTMVALTGAASACTWYFYEPKLPAKLRK